MMEALQREAVIDALLAQVPFDGWSMRSLRQALAMLGAPEADAPLWFPGGPGEMIEAFCALADTRMAAEAAAAGLAAYRLPGRVRTVIGIRLEQNRPHREAIRRALAWLSLPGNLACRLRITARTVDTIWKCAGDRSADFSWYTKRAILAGVYGSTLLFWLRATEEDDLSTMAFLNRRLEDVARIGKLRRRLENGVQGLRPWRVRAAPGLNP